MDKDLDNLKKKWEGAKNQHVPVSNSASELVKMADSKKKASIYFHYGNIIVLSFFLILVIICFYLLIRFADVLSNIGVAMMVAGLFIRIVIEIFSIRFSRKINISNSALKNTTDTIRFLKFRKIVHGPVTVSLVGLYILGYFFLNPELARHMGWNMIMFWNALAIISAVFIIWQIRKSIRKEMNDLKDILELQKSLEETD